MSGHSHWSVIKHKKGATDAKKGKLFSKLMKNIMIAARSGLDPDTNIGLRYAIDKAKEANMPKANIERGLKKLSDKASGDNLEEITYEGYGSGGVAILVEVVTDNRNRTASTLRKIFDTKGGKMGESGCVSYLFEKKGWIAVPADDKVTEERLMELTMEEGVENIEQEGDVFELTMPTVQFHKVKTALEKAGISIKDSELLRIPTTTVPVDETVGQKILDLIELLEDHEDTQNVYANYNMPEELLAKLQQE